MKKLEINIPIYDQKVTVLYAEKLETVDNYLKDYFRVEFDTDPAQARCYIMPGKELFIGLQKDVKNKYIVHETGHLVFELLNKIGINPTNAQETFCYIQEYLFEKTSQFLKLND